MSRPFVVESKSLATVADLMNSALKINPLQRHVRSNGARLADSSGPKGHGPQRVFDVGEYQLLMLLLVIETKLHESCGLLVLDLQMPKHSVIHMRTIRMHLMQTGTRHQASRAAIGMRAKLLVIGIEKVLEPL